MTLRIALTPGEPAGIGPEILIRLAQKSSPWERIVVADPFLLQERANTLNLPLRIRRLDWEHPPQASKEGEITILPVTLQTASHAGVLRPGNASYVLATLNAAIDACLGNQVAAMVTGPVHKGVINDGGTPFSGHTEYLAHRSGRDQVVMMLATEGLRVALATTHLPLREVADAITPDLLRRVITILHSDLQSHFGLDNPRILVTGLNPHAGEGGHLGREEIEIIEPVLEELQGKGLHLTGPLPADTLFTPRYLEQADAVLAMYHDQGLPVLKYKGFGAAVNITLGLPFIRTSVDHGTALDIAGQGIADEGSFRTAEQYAADMATARRQA